MKRGHKWIAGYNGFRTPVQQCGRMFCKAERVDPTLPPHIQVMLGHVIKEEG